MNRPKGVPRGFAITPLKAIERNGLKGFGFSITFEDTPSFSVRPNESETTEPLVPLSGSNPDEVSSSHASSGPIPGGVR